MFFNDFTGIFMPQEQPSHLLKIEKGNTKVALNQHVGRSLAADQTT